MKSLAAKEPILTSDKNQQLSAGEYLNAYDILDLSAIRRPVTTYSVTIHRPKDRSGQTHTEAKQAIWQARKMYAANCRGYGFVIPVNEMSVAVPASWELPTPIDNEDFSIVDDRTWQINPENPEDAPIVAGLIQDAVKKHFNVRKR